MCSSRRLVLQYFLIIRLQVAVSAMPLNSKIIGVDLCSIKPIPNVKTFVEDITTQNCYAAIKKELRNEEVVLLLL